MWSSGASAFAPKPGFGNIALVYAWDRRVGGKLWETYIPYPIFGETWEEQRQLHGSEPGWPDQDAAGWLDQDAAWDLFADTANKTRPERIFRGPTIEFFRKYTRLNFSKSIAMARIHRQYGRDNDARGATKGNGPDTLALDRRRRLTKEFALEDEIRYLLSPDELTRYFKTANHFAALKKMYTRPPVSSVADKFSKYKKSLNLGMMSSGELREVKERLRAAVMKSLGLKKPEKSTVQEDLF